MSSWPQDHGFTAVNSCVHKLKSIYMALGHLCSLLQFLAGFSFILSQLSSRSSPQIFKSVSILSLDQFIYLINQLHTLISSMEIVIVQIFKLHQEHTLVFLANINHFKLLDRKCSSLHIQLGFMFRHLKTLRIKGWKRVYSQGMFLGRKLPFMVQRCPKFLPYSWKLAQTFTLMC